MKKHLKQVYEYLLTIFQGNEEKSQKYLNLYKLAIEKGYKPV